MGEGGGGGGGGGGGATYHSIDHLRECYVLYG